MSTQDSPESAETAGGGRPRLSQLFDMTSSDGRTWRSLTRITAVPARLFGGQLVAQGLAAAGRTVETGFAPISLHAVFLRPGDASVTPSYDVERVRDGRAFATRAVRAVQQERELVRMVTLWQRPETWLTHDDGEREPLPERPPNPAPLPYPAHGLLSDELDLRWIDTPSGRGLWFRTLSDPGDALGEVSTALYVADLWLLDTLLRRHGTSYDSPTVRASSLDFAAWFHRQPDLRRWTFLGSTSPVANAGRGLVEATLRDESGRRVATVVQDVSVRRRTSFRTSRSI